jgi:ADP-heptose:LPS heptosyltransferase
MLSIAQDLKKWGHEVVVMATHGEVFAGQSGVDRLYWTGGSDGFWEKECRGNKVLTFPYWEISGRMRNLPDTLLNTLRDMAGLKPATEFPTIAVSENDVSFAKELKDKLGRGYVVIHRGLGRPIKLLSMETTLEVVESLKAKYEVVQIGYPHDPRIPGTLDLTKGTSFTRSVAVMAEAEFIVGHDSMPNHLSGMIEVPGVFVFGPTSPLDFGYGHNENVFTGMCSQDKCGAPCGRPATWFYDYLPKEGGGVRDWECPNRTCIDEVTSSMIMSAVEKLQTRIVKGIDWTPRGGIIACN